MPRGTWALVCRDAWTFTGLHFKSMLGSLWVTVVCSGAGACGEAGNPARDGDAAGVAEAHYVRGILAAELGSRAGARFHYTQAIRLRPDHARALHRRGAEAADLETALQDLDRAVAADPLFAEALCARARVRGARGERHAALADLQRAVDLDGSVALAWSRMWPAFEDPADAVERLSEELEADPEDFFAWLARANARLAIGDEDGALEDHGAAARIEPTSGVAYLARAEIHLGAGRVAQALDELAVAVERASGSPRARELRGLCRYLSGDFTGAENDLTRALELDPRRASSAALRGFARFALGGVDDALADLLLAHELDAERMFDCGPLSLHERDLAQASRDFSRRAEGEPLAAFLLGNTRYREGLAAEAVAAYTRALELSPGFALASMHRGRARRSLGDDQGALRDFDDALAQDERLVRALCERGALYFELGEVARAQDDFERATALGPRSARAWRGAALARLEADPRRALELFSQALHFDPRDAAALRGRAAAFEALGNHPAARRDRRCARALETGA